VVDRRVAVRQLDLNSLQAVVEPMRDRQASLEGKRAGRSRSVFRLRLRLLEAAWLLRRCLVHRLPARDIIWMAR
jgi:hypothetical protein